MSTTQVYLAAAVGLALLFLYLPYLPPKKQRKAQDAAIMIALRCK